MHATSSPEHAAAAGAAADPLARDLYALIVYLHKRCAPDLVTMLETLELTLSQLKLLHQLERHEQPVTVKEAGELLPLSLPATSRMVDDLVRRGLAERHEDAVDRRMKRVSVTDAGRRVIRRLNASRLGTVQEFAAGLSDEERRRLASTLELVLERPQIGECRLQEGDL
jgi:DNA-binding MarR family transcriptional regulator